MNVLIKFGHGLGDAVQLTLVLKHIKKQRPEWNVDVVSGIGKSSCFRGLCRNSYESESQASGKYDSTFNLGWFENYNGYKDRQHTKVTNSIDEELGLVFDPKIVGYQIDTTDEENRDAVAYLDSITDKKFVDYEAKTKKIKHRIVVLHYQGNTSQEKKNLHPNQVKALIWFLVSNGYKIVLLDWDNRSDLVDNVNVFCPDSNHPLWKKRGTGDAATIKALIENSALFVGIDSGPGHVAGACENTKALIVWTGHHPMQFYDPCDNVKHIIPDDHGGYFNGKAGHDYFVSNYNFCFYSTKYRPLISTAIVNEAAKCLRIEFEDGTFNYRGVFIRSFMVDQDQEIVEDVIFSDSYQTRHYDIKKWKLVIDVGAQIGSFAKLIHSINPECEIICVEPSPDNLSILRKNVSDFATIIDAAMMSEGQNGRFAVFSEPRGDDRASTGGGSVRGRHWAGKEREEQKIYEVEVRSFDSIAQCRFVDCLKLDCEGSEYEILEGNILEKVGIVMGEWHGSYSKFTRFIGSTFEKYNFGDMSQHDDNSTNGIFHLSAKR